MSNDSKIPAYETQIGDLVEGRQYYFHPEREGYMFPALVIDVVPDRAVGVVPGGEWAQTLVCLCADCLIREFPIYWCKLRFKSDEIR